MPAIIPPIIQINKRLFFIGSDFRIKKKGMQCFAVFDFGNNQIYTIKKPKSIVFNRRAPRDDFPGA